MKMKKMLVFLAALLFSSAVSAVAQENQLTAWMDGLLSEKTFRLHSAGRLKTE